MTGRLSQLVPMRPIWRCMGTVVWLAAIALHAAVAWLQRTVILSAADKGRDDAVLNSRPTAHRHGVIESDRRVDQSV